MFGCEVSLLSIIYFERAECELVKMPGLGVEGAGSRVVKKLRNWRTRGT